MVGKKLTQENIVTEEMLRKLNTFFKKPFLMKFLKTLGLVRICWKFLAKIGLPVSKKVISKKTLISFEYNVI